MDISDGVACADFIGNTSIVLPGVEESAPLVEREKVILVVLIIFLAAVNRW